MDKELNYVRNLFLEIFDRHKGEYDDPPPNIIAILDKVQTQFARFSDRGVLEQALPSDENPSADFKDLNQFMYLRPTDEGTVPLITMRSDFSRSWPELRIRLALFLLGADGDVKSIGYRFETPEGMGGGRHDYFHVQPIRCLFTQAPQFPLSCPDWFPDTHPTWPMDAEDPVTLCLSLLVSIYGIAYCSELLQRVPMANQLKSYLKKIRCFNPRPEITYYEVSHQNAKHYYRTFFPKDKFEKFCKNTYGGGYATKSITNLVYSKIGENLQKIC